MILTAQAQVSAASDAELLETYRHLTGRAVVAFDSRAVAERRVIDALMASADLRGHLGVPKETRPAPTGMAELVELADETARDGPTTLAKEGLPGSLAGVQIDASANPYPPGSLAARLWARAEGLPPPAAPAPPPKPAPTQPTRRQDNKGANWIRVAQGAPTAKLTRGSTRHSVFTFIENCAGSGTTYAVLLAEFGPPARDCVNKLLKTKHVEEFIPAPPPKESP